MIKNFCEFYRRWRHTRGFGIHSPFAYRLVTEAIRPARGYAYYHEHDPGMPPLRRLAYRVEIFLRQEIGMSPRSDLSQWLATPDHPLLIIKDKDPIPPETESLVSGRMRDLNHGLLLSSPRFLLAIPRPCMAYTGYLLL
ncbi:MAG: hypothetical protein K2M31_05385 [Muribaculaceae bacterium]|nr:hypothetical protein [Muribaculaceae bacterium]